MRTMYDYFMFETLKIFYHALVNNDKNNKCFYYVMKFPYFLELIIMLMLNINVIILYKIESTVTTLGEERATRVA